MRFVPFIVTGSPKRKKSPKRRTPTPEPEPEPAPPEPTGPPPPQPGSEDWVWVSEPIDEVGTMNKREARILDIHIINSPYLFKAL